MGKRDNVELRSEKVRSIIGKVPSALLRMGVVIISIVIFIILTLMYYVPYPRTKKIYVEIACIDSVYIAIGKLKINDAKSIMIGQSATVVFFSIAGDYTAKGNVFEITEADNNAFIKLQILPAYDILKRLDKRPSGEATVLISNMSILKQILME